MQQKVKHDCFLGERSFVATTIDCFIVVLMCPILTVQNIPATKNLMRTALPLAFGSFLEYGEVRIQLLKRHADVFYLEYN